MELVHNSAQYSTTYFKGQVKSLQMQDASRILINSECYRFDVENKDFVKHDTIIKCK